MTGWKESTCEEIQDQNLQKESMIVEDKENWQDSRSSGFALHGKVIQHRRNTLLHVLHEALVLRHLDIKLSCLKLEGIEGELLGAGEAVKTPFSL